jgi:hypothetical protein
MNYIYGRQGGPCHPITSAYTSNHKFLPPLDKLYFKTNTYMLQYPGTETRNAKFKNTNELDNIYYGKTFEDNNIAVPEKKKQCSSCS